MAFLGNGVFAFIEDYLVPLTWSMNRPAKESETTERQRGATTIYITHMPVQPASGVLRAWLRSQAEAEPPT